MQGLVSLLMAVCGQVAFAAPVDTLADARAGDLEFLSVTPRGHTELAQGTFSKTPAVVQGRLLMPAVATGARVPAIVIQHGSSGLRPHYYSTWAKAFVDKGYAAFVIDSFSGRNLVGTAEHQTLLNNAADAADAFNALRLLSTHPAIDPARIGVLGLSRGGMNAMVQTHEKFRVAILGTSDLRFAVALAHYPACHHNFYESVPTRTPIRIFLGEKDDFVLPSQCLAYAEFLRAKGYDVTTKVYPDNGHSYDFEHQQVFQPRSQKYGKCEPMVTNLSDPSPMPVNIRTGVPLSSSTDSAAIVRQVYQWLSSCMSYGATTGHNPRADIRQQAVADTLSAFEAAVR